jgi:glycosyltransferase involved in cell wall biosynthesis
LSQDRPPDEIVIVDDGSSDDTLLVLEAMSDVRIRVVSQPHSGVATSRNRILAEAESEWVAFLDSDDLWVPEHLKRIEKSIAATDRAADLYFGDTRINTADGEMSSYWRESGFAIAAPFELLSDATEWVSLPLQPMAITASVVSRRHFLSTGGFLTRLQSREDTHLFLANGPGRPWCAVAGAGTIVTNDAGQERLTAAHDSRTESYLRDTIAMYEDLITRVGSHSPDLLKMLRRRLSIGHWRLSRLQLAQRHPGQCTRSIARSLAISPTQVPLHLLGRIARK